MGKAFHDRRHAMEVAFQENRLTVAGQGAFGGSSFWMRAPEGVDTKEVAARLLAKGVLIEPGRAFFITEEAPQNYYRLAYSSLSVSKISDGVKLVADEIRQI